MSVHNLGRAVRPTSITHICMYMCMYMYACVHTHTIHMSMYLCTVQYTCTRMYVCMYVCTRQHHPVSQAVKRDSLPRGTQFTTSQHTHVKPTVNTQYRYFRILLYTITVQITSSWIHLSSTCLVLYYRYPPFLAWQTVKDSTCTGLATTWPLGHSALILHRSGTMFKALGLKPCELDVGMPLACGCGDMQWNGGANVLCNLIWQIRYNTIWARCTARSLGEGLECSRFCLTIRRKHIPRTALFCFFFFATSRRMTRSSSSPVPISSPQSSVFPLKD